MSHLNSAVPNSLTRNARLWSLLWATICVAVATAMVRTMVTDWPQFRASHTWPTASGTITTSRLDSVRNSRGTIHYFPVLAYTYLLADSTYRGTALHLGNPYFNSSADGEFALRHYREGTKAPVHYDPNDPTISVLELRTLTWSDRMLLPMALVALGIGIYCGWEGVTGSTPGRRWLVRN